MPRHMKTAQASKYLEENWGIVRAPGTLRRFRTTGGGPEYLKGPGGEVIYTTEMLDEWAGQRLTKHASTASYTSFEWRKGSGGRAYDPAGRHAVKP